MFMVVHAAVGAAAGQAVIQSSTAFLLGVISHFFLDMIPHGDEGVYQGYVSGSRVKRAVLMVGADAVLTAVLVVALFWNPELINVQTAAWGVVGGLLPDVMVAVSQIFRPKKDSGIFYRLDLYNRFHRWNHTYALRRWRKEQQDVSFFTGLAYQGVLMLVLLKYVI